MATGLATIYEALRQDPQTHEFVEELHQTDAKEFWHRAIAILRQFSMQMPLSGLLLTHYPYIFANTAFHRLAIRMSYQSQNPMRSIRSGFVF